MQNLTQKKTSKGAQLGTKMDPKTAEHWDGEILKIIKMAKHIHKESSFDDFLNGQNTDPREGRGINKHNPMTDYLTRHWAKGPAN